MTQGNTFNDSEECCGAGHVVDMHLSTAAALLTSDGAGWLKLKFGRTHYIHKVIIYYRFFTDWYDNVNDWCALLVENFIACVNNENNVDVSVYQGEVKQKSCGTLQLTYGLEQSDQIYTLICNTAGDTVKLSKDTGSIVMYEVVVTSRGKLLFVLSMLQSSWCKFSFSPRCFAHTQ